MTYDNIVISHNIVTLIYIYTVEKCYRGISDS